MSEINSEPQTVAPAPPPPGSPAHPLSDQSTQPPAAAPAPDEIQNPPPSANPTPSAPPLGPIKNQNPKIENPRTRNGKVARLPKKLRDRVNWMMLDGVPYADIIASLGKPANHLTENCLSTWKAGGHQDFLKELRLLDEYRLRRELTLDLVHESGGIDAFQAAHKAAAALICEAIAELGAATLRQAVQANPLNLLRMLNSLSRLTAGGLKCERHLDDHAERLARIRAQKRPAKKGLSKAVLKEMNEKLKLM